MNDQKTHEKLLNLISHQGTTNTNHDEIRITLKERHQMLARKCSNCNSATSLVGVWNAVLCKTCSYLMCVHVCDEWVTSTMSCPQQPCSAPANSVYGFFYGVNPSHIWSSSAPAAFYFSQHYCLFQTTVSSHDVPKVGQLQFCHFCLQWCFRLNLF